MVARPARSVVRRDGAFSGTQAGSSMARQTLPAEAGPYPELSHRHTVGAVAPIDRVGNHGAQDSGVGDDDHLGITQILASPGRVTSHSHSIASSGVMHRLAGLVPREGPPCPARNAGRSQRVIATLHDLAFGEGWGGGPMVRTALSPAEVDEVWRRWRSGQAVKVPSPRYGHPAPGASLVRVLNHHGS